VLDKFGGDSMTELKLNLEQFIATARRLPLT
jgi:hypothetical protein